ncbi:MAG: VWA domain-containing protein [Oscillospiraceae bacterium]|nr:VWA domain-containing protein [Oscillospiraceae bacterium]
MNNKLPIIIAATVVVIIGVIIAAVVSGGGDSDSGDAGGRRDAPLAGQDPVAMLETAVSAVKVTSKTPSKAAISYDEIDAAIELPPIDTAYPVVAEPSRKDIIIEVWTSPEKGGTGVESWMRDMAEEFNGANQTVDGKSVGVRLRSISSGTQLDYIIPSVAVPDAISPSASFWADMLQAEGVRTECINPRIVGNVAGVLISKSTMDTLAQTYGTADIKAIVSATEAGTITAGYTNPFASTSGLNFLAAALYNYDSTNPLSEAAVSGFNAFQYNVPFVAFNTMQMRDAAENNTFTSMILEYQTYYNTPDLKNNYEFIPYGVRHDNPLYTIGNISEEKKSAVKLFNDYCMTDKAQKSASDYGFNQLDDYTSGIPATDGKTWLQIQKLWKKQKNATKPIAAVFVLDTSGSMAGEPLKLLKDSLTNSLKYINSSNYIGVISYGTDVNVDLPIAQFDINQQSYFQGAVDGLLANGTTATYSAVAKAVLMLNEFMETNPDVQPMIFLLSDGLSNGGATYNAVAPALEYYRIPVYTIGYNENIPELETIAALNEATCINATTDDVIYKLKNLFNANL